VVAAARQHGDLHLAFLRQPGAVMVKPTRQSPNATSK
jgi:hypothetical protein